MTGETFSSNHPPHPPTSEDDRIARLRLLRSRRVGISTYRRMLAEHKTATGALAALPTIAQARGIKSYKVFSEQAAKDELAAGKRFGAILAFEGETAYPTQLSEIPDAPPMIWIAGRQKVLSKPMIAIVGARNASSLGTRMARKLAGGLAEAGIVVVSGLARGVDAAAHHAALGTGTVAVQGGGVDVIYPAENTELALSILSSGVRLSEQPMGLTPQARHFPRRNRIISGLAQAVVVVEAAAKSGTLITAGQALDQGRDVLAVPGHPIDARAEGCNRLIRDGATLVRCVDDILNIVNAQTASIPPPAVAPPEQVSLGFAEPPAKTPTGLRRIAALHDLILSRLGPSPVGEDQLTRDLSYPTAVVAPALVELELAGRILRQPGGLIAKIPRSERN